ncbi:unnamed protein product [Aureobasidium uvarum]|uniref:Amidase domain-containing protein n=1 Tax=Aureobasidium uvarum TaxID=2773716 RepID=A0A9N8PWQ2_9PEZI|nr:unnamed protein product [Aureobasidium uvarum]
MRFLSSLSVGVALVGAVAGLVTPYNNTSTGLGDFPSLINVTTEDLATGLEAGRFTSVDLVKAYSARIMEVNSTLRMVTEINPDALAIAAELDAMRANGTILGPLHGLPILIKNNIATADQMNNTAGSFALLGAKVPHDSTLAAKLRKAGAIILGKTNLSQWANYRSNNSTNDVNNLVGIKPTVGLTSRYLVIPISEHQDTVGPMARSVKDAAYLLQAIAGVDPNDNYTSAIPNNGSIPDYVGACDYSALAGKRIGVAWNVIDIYGPIDEPVMTAFQESIAIIKRAGATIVDANFTAFSDYVKDNNETLVLNVDFLTNLHTYLAELSYNPNNVTDLAEVRNFTHAFAQEDWPDRDTAVWDDALFNQGWNNSDARFWAAYQANLYYGGEGGILGALSRNNVSAVLLPTQLSPGIPALVGSPVVTVPMGFYPADWNVTYNARKTLVETGPKVPFGLSFMGNKFSEAELIGLAYAYEQRTMHRDDVQPYIIPNIELADFVK